MIATVCGIVMHRDRASVVIDIGGVGYDVHVAPRTLAALRVGESARLWTHEHQRDDGRELYGFVAAEERTLFRRLINVSGVGPKSAMGFMAIGDAPTIEGMIERGDVTGLSAVPGVGKKTAQKIILELKGKLVGAEAETDDVALALAGMGYEREHVRDALSRVGAGPVEERLRTALKELGKR